MKQNGGFNVRTLGCLLEPKSRFLKPSWSLGMTNQGLTFPQDSLCILNHSSSLVSASCCPLSLRVHFLHFSSLVIGNMATGSSQDTHLIVEPQKQRISTLSGQRTKNQGKETYFISQRAHLNQSAPLGCRNSLSHGSSSGNLVAA